MEARAAEPAGARGDKLSLLLELSSMLAREVELDAILVAMGARVARALGAERATVYLVDAATGELRSRVADLPELSEIRLPVGQGVAGHVAETGEVVNLRDAARDPRHFAGVDRATGYTTRTMLTAPIRDGRRAIRGVLQALNKKRGAFDDEDAAFLLALGAQIAQALEGTTLRPRTGDDRGVSLRGPINHVVGVSPAMRAVYEQVARAAATSATVLLRGETGTGKGLFARAIHANCARASGPMVTVDCTTLPAALVESELFGHERGAYTGADARVQGKVELAQGGTLFLDEVGELPAPAQAKLLRFLQERAFERVGGRETLRADVRIVAATHRDLAACVARGEFRQDLFYRLRVVEIELPPLRARGGEEIARLAEHFLAAFARRYGRGDMALSAGAMEALRAHAWPGNVRELEHAIERAVVMAAGAVVEREHLGIAAGAESARGAEGGSQGGGEAGKGSAVGDEGDRGSGDGAVVLPMGLTLAEVEERYVAATLRAHGGNRTRAARALGVGRNTLWRRMRGA